MGLKNYIVPNSYSRIIEVDFNKRSRHLMVRVETTDENGRIILAYPYVANGHIPCAVVDSVFTGDENITTFINNKADTKHLVNVSSESSYAVWNGSVIYFDEAGTLKFERSMCVYDTSRNIYLENDYNGNWTVPVLPSCDKFFDEHFSLEKHSEYTDIYNMAYLFLKMLPEFQSTVDA